MKGSGEVRNSIEGVQGIRGSPFRSFSTFIVPTTYNTCFSQRLRRQLGRESENNRSLMPLGAGQIMRCRNELRVAICSPSYPTSWP